MATTSTSRTLNEYEFEVKIPAMIATEEVLENWRNLLRVIIKAEDREQAERIIRSILTGGRPVEMALEIKLCPWTPS